MLVVQVIKGCKNSKIKRDKTLLSFQLFKNGICCVLSKTLCLSLRDKFKLKLAESKCKAFFIIFTHITKNFYTFNNSCIPHMTYLQQEEGTRALEPKLLKIFPICHYTIALLKITQYWSIT